MGPRAVRWLGGYKALTRAHQVLQVGRKFLGLNTDQKIQVVVAPLLLLGEMGAAAGDAARRFPKDFYATLKSLGDRG